MNIHYVAGLFDGEGYVYIYKIKRKAGSIGHYVCAGITMTHYPTMKAFQDKFGGHLNHNRSDLRNPNNRITFMWGVTTQLAATFLRKVQPYVIIKRDEVDVALALQDNIDQNPYNIKGIRQGPRDRDAILAYREDLLQQCKLLKKRTFPPLTAK